MSFSNRPDTNRGIQAQKRLKTIKLRDFGKVESKSMI